MPTAPLPRRNTGHRCTRHTSIYRPQNYPQMHLHTPLHLPHTETPVHTKGTHINPSERNTRTHAQTHAHRIHPLSQVQPCRGQTGIHKHAHTHRHTYDHTSTIWSLVPQRYLRTDTPLARNPSYTAKSSSACDPGEAASRCSEQPLVSRPVTPTLNPQSPPGGAGLRRERVWNLHNDPGSWRRRAGRSSRGREGLRPTCPRALRLASHLPPSASPERTGRWGAERGFPGSWRPRWGCPGTPAPQGFSGPCSVSDPTRGAFRSRAGPDGQAQPGTGESAPASVAAPTFIWGIFKGPVL